MPWPPARVFTCVFVLPLWRERGTCAGLCSTHPPYPCYIWSFKFNAICTLYGQVVHGGAVGVGMLVFLAGDVLLMVRSELITTGRTLKSFLHACWCLEVFEGTCVVYTLVGFGLTMSHTYTSMFHTSAYLHSFGPLMTFLLLVWTKHVALFGILTQLTREKKMAIYFGFSPGNPKSCLWWGVFRCKASCME